jgi:hypothetical protein
VGSALVWFSSSGTKHCLRVRPQAITWPSGSEIAPDLAADVIDDFARGNGVFAVSLDGPQGWRDPDAPPSQGFGRACEKSAHTPGKTGAYGRTYPRNQVGWISFSIRVFDRLIEHGAAQLANAPGELPYPSPLSGAYLLVECFPTVTWRSSGLAPLPAKRRRPNIATFASALASRWRLPALGSTLGHDDLQAVVAALPAAALFGAGSPIDHGVPARVHPSRGAIPAHRVEGIIWDARP